MWASLLNRWKSINITKKKYKWYQTWFITHKFIIPSNHFVFGFTSIFIKCVCEFIDSLILHITASSVSVGWVIKETGQRLTRGKMTEWRFGNYFCGLSISDLSLNFRELSNLEKFTSRTLLNVLWFLFCQYILLTNEYYSSIYIWYILSRSLSC